MKRRVVLMNAPVATVAGVYEMVETTLEEVFETISEPGVEIVSFIGHQGTADVLMTLLSIPVEVNRGQYRHEVGDTVIVFRLAQRQPEGAVLTAEEIEKIGYQFVFFNRIA